MKHFVHNVTIFPSKVSQLQPFLTFIMYWYPSITYVCVALNHQGPIFHEETLCEVCLQGNTTNWVK